MQLSLFFLLCTVFPFLREGDVRLELKLSLCICRGLEVLGTVSRGRTRFRSSELTRDVEESDVMVELRPSSLLSVGVLLEFKGACGLIAFF